MSTACAGRAGPQLDEHEQILTPRFSDRSMARAYAAGINTIRRWSVMAEFIRSGLIILMGMTVMAAGVLVIFYG
ncbi:MAG: hypothetical protein M5U16_15045 [Hyphomicrobium sp.]|nr:hypothetical protein [Hyphomicrobium sp.]